jgi:hypothetical protein
LFQKVDARKLAATNGFLALFSAKNRVTDAMVALCKSRFFWEYVHTVRFLMA